MCIRQKVNSIKSGMKFKNFVTKQKDFQYTEGKGAFFYPEESVDENRKLAFELRKDGSFRIGYLDREDTFVLPKSTIKYTEKRKNWISKMLLVARAYVLTLPKKKKQDDE